MVEFAAFRGCSVCAGTVLSPSNQAANSASVPCEDHFDTFERLNRYAKIAAVKPRGMFREMPPDERAEVATGGGDSSSDWELPQPAGDLDQSLNELLAKYAAAVSRTAEEGGAL